MEKVFKAQSGEFSIARAVIYRVLARCFSYPDRELVGLFDSGRIEEFLESWQYVGLDPTESIAKAADWLAQWPSQETALKELEKEYTRLFVNAYTGVIAPPYSSVYLNKERLVWGKSTAEVARLYEATGLGIADNFHDIPDHIAAELEFASYLIAEQQKGEQDGSCHTQELASIEKKLLREHLFRWAPAFFSRVIEYSKVTFYREIARLGQQLIDYETKNPPWLCPKITRRS